MDLYDIKTKEDVINYIQEHKDINYYKGVFGKKSILFYDLPYETLKYILYHTNVDTSFQDEFGNNALFFVKNARNANLLIRYIDIHHNNNEGQNALFYVNDEVSYALIRAGIDINHKDNNGNNASFLYDFSYAYLSIYSSFRDKDFAKLKLLISEGIDIANINNNGHNILFSGYRFDKEIYKLLWDNGVDFSTRNNIKDCFLCRYGQLNKDPNDLNNEMISAIDFSYPCEKMGKTIPLLFLIINRWKNRETLSAIKNINSIIYNGFNILSEIESITLFKYIIKKTDIDINFINGQGRNLLFSHNINIKKFDFLKSQGVNVFLEDNHGLTAFDFHIKLYNEQVKEKHKSLKYRKKYADNGEVAFEILNVLLGIEGLNESKYVISLLEKKALITEEYISNIKETGVLYYELRSTAGKNKKKLRI